MQTVLNISKHDAIGRRFNNLDARQGFSVHGWEAKYACWTQRTESSEFVQQAGNSLTRKVTPILAKIGRRTGNINGLYRNAEAITGLSFYRDANLLHFHIVHEEYLSIRDWIKIAGNKPLVWTWHDPYMLSGHCIYSMGCRELESGCNVCPNLHYHFPIKRDRSKINLEEKVAAIKHLDPLVLVASDYMQDLVRSSIHSRALRLKVLPFGVHMEASPSVADAKSRLGIPRQNVVIGFRAVYSDYKGLPLIQAALRRLSAKYPDLPLTIIAFQERGCCGGLSANYQVLETGWISDSSISQYYSAMDFFLMPSKAEAFGLMAIEAMASGATPIVTMGTALPSLVGAPVFGLCSDHTESAFSDVVESAVLKSTRNASGREARIAFAREKYNMEQFCEKLSGIYDEETEYSSSKRRSS